MKRIRSTLALVCLFWLGVTVLRAEANTCDGALSRTAPVNRFNYSATSDFVYDTQTKLSWKRCPVGYTYNAGSAVCEITPAGIPTLEEILYDIDVIEPNGDWRLPGLKELNSILELACLPVLNYELFPQLNNTTDVDELWMVANYPLVKSYGFHGFQLSWQHGTQTYPLSWDGKFSYFEYNQFGLGSTASHGMRFLYYLVSGPD